MIFTREGETLYFVKTQKTRDRSRKAGKENIRDRNHKIRAVWKVSKTPTSPLKTSRVKTISIKMIEDTVIDSNQKLAGKP